MTNIIGTRGGTRSYADLLVEYLPRPIRSEEDADVVQALMDTLMDKGDLTEDERDFLLLLGSLMLLWEPDQSDLPALAPNEMVKALLEARELPQQALVGPVFPTKGIASEILNGKRRLTYDFVQRLATFFEVSPDLFYPSQATASSEL